MTKQELIEKYLSLKQEYLQAKGKENKNRIFAELSVMMRDYPDIAAEAEAQEDVWVNEQKEKEKELGLSVKEKLGTIMPILPGAYIAKTYFGKTGSWFSQRINCLTINGKVARFSAVEIQTLQDALHDIGRQFMEVKLIEDDEPTPSAQLKESPENQTEQHIWLMPSNNKIFRVDDCIKDRGVIFWRQYNNLAIGDTVFIYGSKPDSRIKFQMSVLAVDLPHSDEVNDKEYWVNPDDFENRSLHNRYMKLELVKALDSPAMSLESLLEHGLKGAPQGAMKISGELLEFVWANV